MKGLDGRGEALPVLAGGPGEEIAALAARATVLLIFLRHLG